MEIKTYRFIYFFLLLFSITSCRQTQNKKSQKNTILIGQISNLSVINKDHWIQEHAIIVHGSLEEIWNLYTTSEKLKTHVAPIIEVEFKNGGRWEASYDLNAKIGDSANFVNEIINIIPNRQFTTKGVKAPFDIEALKSLRSTMLFEDLGENRVKVHAITTGWSGISDLEYRKKVFDMSGQTNPEILKCLDERLTNGPLNWEKLLNINTN